uniref:Chemotaxis protein n=1 Tax=Rhabditophanes sp. KR3021 TaxID=114890 RepID=A0AC35TTW5_9BILA
MTRIQRRSRSYGVLARKHGGPKQEPVNRQRCQDDFKVGLKKSLFVEDTYVNSNELVMLFGKYSAGETELGNGIVLSMLKGSSKGRNEQIRRLVNHLEDIEDLEKEARKRIGYAGKVLKETSDQFDERIMKLSELNSKREYFKNGYSLICQTVSDKSDQLSAVTRLIEDQVAEVLNEVGGIGETMSSSAVQVETLCGKMKGNLAKEALLMATFLKKMKNL